MREREREFCSCIIIKQGRRSNKWGNQCITNKSKIIHSNNSNLRMQKFIHLRPEARFPLTEEDYTRSKIFFLTTVIPQTLDG